MDAYFLYKDELFPFYLGHYEIRSKHGTFLLDDYRKELNKATNILDTVDAENAKCIKLLGRPLREDEIDNIIKPLHKALRGEHEANFITPVGAFPAEKEVVIHKDARGCLKALTDEEMLTDGFLPEEVELFTGRIIRGLPTVEATYPDQKTKIGTTTSKDLLAKWNPFKCEYEQEIY